MVWVVPPPVLGSSVIVIEDPLQTLQVLMQHLLLKADARRRSYILVELLLIVERLGLNRVSTEQ